ncbi:unnamed protein product [Clonostachys chloroleuca]|uniref:Uncharacterized protein n=1 Tax=Clonostachys chloroleuca TaxID=1926264 RepID=A0AA35Q3Q8_9HYPO|nr:unnamed protein product [Clonostachys chloroleuca]
MGGDRPGDSDAPRDSVRTEAIYSWLQQTCPPDEVEDDERPSLKYRHTVPYPYHSPIYPKVRSDPALTLHESSSRFSSRIALGQDDLISQFCPTDRDDNLRYPDRCMRTPGDSEYSEESVHQMNHWPVCVSRPGSESSIALGEHTHPDRWRDLTRRGQNRRFDAHSKSRSVATRDRARELTNITITNSLAGPGWRDVDRDPDFHISTSRSGSKRVVSKDGIQVSSPQPRKAWKVGVAYKPFRPMKYVALKDDPLNELCAHWGVYFCELDAPEPNYRVCSMDFKDETMKELAVQTVWCTPTRRWRRKMYEDEILKVRRYKEHIIYCSLEELLATAQIVLEEFLDHHYSREWHKALAKSKRAFNKHIDKFGKGDSGGLYSVLSRNCQDWAVYLLDNIVDQGWGDLQRQREAWDPKRWLKAPPKLLRVPPSKKWSRISFLLDKLAQVLIDNVPIALATFAAVALFDDMKKDKANDRRRSRSRESSDYHRD